VARVFRPAFEGPQDAGARRWRGFRAALMVALAAVVSLALMSCSSSARPSASSSHPSSSAAIISRVSVGCEGRLVSPAILAAITFLTDSDGIGLVIQSGLGGFGPRLVVTTDGGRTWHVTGARLPLESHVSGSATTGPTLFFPMRRTGWVYVAGELLHTVDSGATWSVARFCAPVEGVSGLGRSILVVVAPCPATPHRYQVESATSSSRWHVVTSLHSAIHGEYPALVVRVDATVLIDLNYGSVGDLSLTRDGGRTWRSVDACGASGFPIWLNLQRPQVFWLVCEAPPITVENYSVLRSEDGVDWQSVATSFSLGRGFTVLLPGGSFVALAGESDGKLWLATQSHIYESRNRGKQWNVASPNLNGVVSGPFVFADPRHGWVLAPGAGLWQTTDGRTWRLER